MRQVDSPKTASLLAADMTAAEIYESVTNGGASDFAELVTVLNRNKPWCLIGGLAVNCYVEPVYTVDVDLVVVAANLEQIGRELEAAGFRLKRFEHSMNAQRPSSESLFGCFLNAAAVVFRLVRMKGVMVPPGHTAFTRTPCGASSTAALRVMATIAALDAS